MEDKEANKKTVIRKELGNRRKDLMKKEKNKEEKRERDRIEQRERRQGIE